MPLFWDLIRMQDRDNKKTKTLIRRMMPPQWQAPRDKPPITYDPFVDIESLKEIDSIMRERSAVEL